MNDFIVYVDVDDTLVRTVGTKRIPIRGAIDHVRELKNGGAILYCWSAGGAAYARQSAEELGLIDCFEMYLPKPNLMIDDQATKDWSLCIMRHPVELSHDAPSDYWELIRSKRSL